jgi:prepilin-type N-terminal cleavage/methylation domain-containing protein
MKKTLKIFGQYKKSRGFTLIEMSVVLLIIGVLSAIILRGIGSQPIQARDSRRISDLRTLAIYLAQYMTKKGEFPPESDIGSSASSWTKLVPEFQGAGMSLYSLPLPPTQSEEYVYYSCNGGKNFVLRAKLEQTATAAPRVYEGTYDKSSHPFAACDTNGVPTFDCLKSNNYYCLVQ